MSTAGLPALQPVVDAARLPDQAFSHRNTIWWGVVGLITIEGVVFASLIASFFYLQSGRPDWPPAGTAPPELMLPTLATVLLLLSSVPMALADRALRHDRTGPLKWMPLVSVALALAFLGIKAYEYSHIGFRWNTHAYGSVVWTMIGFHTAHVMALVLKTMVVTALAWKGFFHARNRIGVTSNGIYWHFVVAVWLPLYATIYLASHWLRG